MGRIALTPQILALCTYTSMLCDIPGDWNSMIDVFVPKGEVWHTLVDVIPESETG